MEQYLGLEVSIDNGAYVSCVLTRQAEAHTQRATESEPDLTWSYVDPSGHYHAWGNARNTPTLTAVVCDTCDDFGTDACDKHDGSGYVCRLCAASVPTPPQKSRQVWARSTSLITWYVDVPFVPNEVYDRSLAFVPPGVFAPRVSLQFKGWQGTSPLMGFGLAELSKIAHDSVAASVGPVRLTGISALTLRLIF